MSSPNIICICLDTFRADILTGKLSSVVHTPNIDSFVREAVEFTQAFGEGQPTLQVRRAFFTGERSFPWKYNFDRRGHWHHAAGWHKIPPEQDTLAEILLHRGFMTGMVADTYHMFKPTMNYTRGFATYDFIRGQETDNWRAARRSVIEERLHRYTRTPTDLRRNAPLVQYLANIQDREREEDYFAAKVFIRAQQWIKENVDNQPFFLWVDSFDPHEPWDPPKSYSDIYRPDYTGKDFIYPHLAWQDQVPSTEEIERIKALYYGEVTFVDRWFGHFLDTLQKMGVLDNSIIMVLSDHGTQLMEHGRVGKDPYYLHPYNTQVAWVIRHPDGPHGHKVHEFVQTHDVFATVLGFLDIPYSCAGQNAWDLVTGKRKTLRDHVVIGWAGWNSGNAVGRASVRDKEWNFVATVGQEDNAFEQELYHLTEDPDENQNVIDQFPEIVALQRRRLEEVMGQPLPGRFNEVCDLVRGPIDTYLSRRK